MYERASLHYGLAQQRPDEDEWPSTGDDWEPARDMPALEDVKRRIAEVTDELRDRGKIALSGNIVMACHFLPYVCNLHPAGPESPNLQVEIRPSDIVTMPQGLHSPTSGCNGAEAPISLAQGLHFDPPSRSSSESDGLQSLATPDPRSQPGSGVSSPPTSQSWHSSVHAVVPSRPPSPGASQYFSALNGAVHVHKNGVHPPHEQHRWLLEPRRGHAALNAGIRSLADRQLTLVAWPGDLKDDKGEHLSSSLLSEDQRQALDDGLARLAYDGGHLARVCGRGAPAKLEGGIKCVPVWVDDKEATLHYESFCKGYLWPIFHYMPLSEHQDATQERAAWKAYEAVNMAFARKIAEVYKPGDMVWIQDYHLLLVPALLKKMRPDCHIGLFLHSPFPSSELFRCLPRREAILTGMLGANLLCFQTYSYGRHFVSACIRVMGYESVGAGIEANGNVTAIAHCPIGIDADRIEKDRTVPGVEAKISVLRKLYDGVKIIIGRDKLDPTKGVLPKLRAFEEFLRRYPEWRGKVALIQVTTPSPTDSVHLAAKISELVDHINATYGSLHFQPVHHYHQMIERDEYFALLTVADLAMITSVRDGMNTMSMEYTICQARVGESGANPIILSEFTGVTGSMKAAIKVNPWDLGGVAIAINQCLTMPRAEKLARHAQLYSRVKSHSSAVWASSLILQLLECLGKGHAADYVKSLDEDRLLRKYEKADKRLLLFDYDGTLSPIVKNPADALPPPGLLDALQALCDDERNIVYIISGRDGAFLQEHLGHIKNLGMSAEHGCYLREPGAEEFIDLTAELDMSWMQDVEEIFKYYAARTLGAQVEKKVSSVTWHYRQADPEFGLFQAKECQALLESMQERLPIDVLVGKKNLEVRPAHTNKGEIVKRLLYSSPEVGFALCAGDDKTDEDMFRALRLLSNSCPEDQQPTILPPESIALLPTMMGRAGSIKGPRSRASSVDPSERIPRPTRRRFSGTSGTSPGGSAFSPKLEPVQSELDPKAIFAVVIDQNETRKTLADQRVANPLEFIRVLKRLAASSIAAASFTESLGTNP